MKEAFVFEAMYRSGVIPVVTVQDPQKAVRLAKAVWKGGLSVLEIALRVQGAADCIRAVRAALPEMAVGAGTVLTRPQVLEAKAAGAMFGVSPGYDEDVVSLSREVKMPFVPGAVTATDIQKGIKAGLKTIKFFPAEPHGGLKTIDYLAPPFPMVKFLPAGGIGFHNLDEYLQNPAVLACAGGFMARAGQIEAEDWETITALCGRIAQAAGRRRPMDQYA